MLKGERRLEQTQLSDRALQHYSAECFLLVFCKMLCAISCLTNEWIHLCVIAVLLCCTGSDHTKAETLFMVPTACPAMLPGSAPSCYVFRSP